jgi:phage FluMu gp28-like protein
MPLEIWEYAILPALTDHHAPAWFTGTPKRRNWYYLLCMKGYDPLETDYKSWCFSSYDNTKEKGGYVAKEDLDIIVRNMSERARRQEIEGEFLSDVGAMFRDVRTHIHGDLETANSAKHYAAGVDLGKHEDYSVIAILDQHGHVCHFDRRNRIDWVFQKKWIADIIQRYNMGTHGCRLLMDSTGLGDPFLDEFKRLGLPVEGYKFTQPSKHDLIENLSIQLENNKISYPDIPELLTELDLFGYTTTVAGNVQYTAPEGFHDDCVVALALAAWQLTKGGGPKDAWRLG